MLRVAHRAPGHCLFTPPLLVPEALGHVTNKLHPELDNASYRLAFDKATLDKVRKTPASALRLAVIYDDDVLITNISMAPLRKASDSGIFEIMRL